MNLEMDKIKHLNHKSYKTIISYICACKAYILLNANRSMK